jgi:hypothetical protein
VYPKNAATPPPISIGQVIQIADGAVQTSGVSVTIIPYNSPAAAGQGSVSYQNGIVRYTPTQAETNYLSFELIAYKSDCYSANTTVLTTAADTQVIRFGAVSAAEVNNAFTEIKGAGWSSTDTLKAIKDASGNTFYFNNPIQSNQIPTNISNLLTIDEGSTAPVTITNIRDIYDSPVDLSSFTNLKIVIQKKSGSVLQTVVHADITVSGTNNNNVTFANNTSVSAKGSAETELLWALRDADNGDKVIVKGVVLIDEAATSA